VAAAFPILTTINARELYHFFKLRLCERAQWEIRELAEKMLLAVKQKAPLLFAKAGPSCVVLGYCPEGDHTCGKFKEMMGKYRG
jgi:thymidylate synthase (FAD)